jgi:PAS domain S-box-containing protein
MPSTVLGRVLVVDDEFQLMEALVEALNAQGYVAHGFLTGVDAIEALQQQEFDLLLADLMMPGMDGIALLNASMIIDQNLVGIIMTGQGTVPTAVEAMKSGAFDYVLKPFRLEALLPVLARAIKVRRLRLENIQLRETVAIYDLSQTIALSLDSKLVLENTADAALKQADADEVSIMLLKPEKQELYIAVVRGRDREHLLGKHISLQEGIAGWVARHFEPLILHGQVSDPRFMSLWPRADIRSAISMPMLTGGELVGVLNINSLQPRRAFTPGQVKALSILTSTAAAAWQNQALYRALEAREKRFRALTENSPDGITVVDKKGRVLYVSPSVERILGYSQAEVLGRPAIRYIHREDRSQFLQELARLTEQPGRTLVQYRFRHKDRSWRWLESTISNLIGEPGFEGIVFNYRDITERKRAEEAVIESERAMRALVTSLDDIVFEFDEQGTYLNIWAADENLLSQPKDQLLGKRIVEVLGEETGGPFAEAVKRVVISGRPESIEYPLEVTGGQRWFLARISPIVDSDNTYRSVSMLIRNITERKQAEQAYAAIQKRFQALIEHAPDGIALLDITGKLQQVTPSTEHILGYPLQEAVSQDPGLLTHPDDLPVVLSLLNDLIQHPGSVASIQYRFRHKDGSWRWLDSTISNLLAEPSVAAIVFNYRDITGRKQAENALQQAKDFAENVIQTANVIFLQLDTAGNVLKLNAAAEEISGYSRSEIEGKNWFETLVPRDRYIYVWEEFIRIAQRGETPKIFENPILTKQSSERYIIWKNNVLREEGRIVGTISFGVDITERKQAEEALQEKEQLLSEAQRIGHIGSWSYDIITDTFQYSDEMYHLLDISPLEFQHNRDGFLGLISSIYRPEVTKWFGMIIAGRQVRDLDFRFFRQNGELRYVQVRGAILYDSNGKPARFTGTAQDVTDRKIAEIQIRQQIDRLKALRRIDEAITSSFNLQSNLNAVLSQTITQLTVDAADILLLHSEEQILKYASSQGFRTKIIESSVVRIGDDYAGRAANERCLIHIDNLEEQPGKEHLNTLIAGENFVCYYAVPLIAKGKVRGVLEIFHRMPLQPYPEWLDFLETLAEQAAIAIDNATLFENLEDANRELLQAYDATIEGWSRALDLRDKETEGHTLRVTEMTLILAHKFNFADEELQHIRWGALLHDIGKLGVPDSILLKPGTLTDEEWVNMRKHPTFAYEMLLPIHYLQAALDIPYCHHEKWDGTGYPRALKGEAIPLAARLFAIVDIWDALTNDRPYRAAWTREEATQYIIDQSEKHFDPRVVEPFLDLVRRRNEK